MFWLKVKRLLLFSVAVLALILAVFGAILPLLPTVPFLLLSAICFAKSSEKMHTWLLSNQYFGAMISNWQQHRCMQRKAKVRAIIFVALSLSFSIYTLEITWLRLALFCLMLGLIYRISRIPQCETR